MMKLSILSLAGLIGAAPVQVRNDWVLPTQSRQFPPDKNPCQNIPGNGVLNLDPVGAGNKYYLFNQTAKCAEGGFYLAITVNGFDNFTYANIGCDGPTCAQENMCLSLLTPTGATLECCEQGPSCDQTVIGYTSTQPVIVRIRTAKAPLVQIRNDWSLPTQLRQFPPQQHPCQPIAGNSVLDLNVTGAGNKYYIFNQTAKCTEGGFYLAITVNGFGNFTYANIGCDGPTCAQENMCLTLFNPAGVAFECCSQAKCNDSVIGFTASEPVVVRIRGITTPLVQICNQCNVSIHERKFPPESHPCHQIPGRTCLARSPDGPGNKYYIFNDTATCSEGGFYLAITVNGFGNFTYANIGCDGPTCAQENMCLTLLAPTGTLKCCSEGPKCDQGVVGYTHTEPVIVQVSCF